MKKYLALICATMLCVCCLAVTACGGQASSSAASSASGSASSETASSSASASSASSSAASLTQKLAGNWKIAGAKYQSLIITGDMSKLMDNNGSMSLTINEDGTGKMYFGNDSADITWETTGTDSIKVIPQNEGSSQSQTVPCTYADGILSMQMSDDEFTGEVMFTKDGTMPGVRDLSIAASKDVQSESALLGTWTLCGMSISGMSMYGEPKDLAAMAGYSDQDMTLVIEQGGTAKAFSEDATWAMGANGATLALSGIELPLKSVDDLLLVDMTQAMGSETAFLFAK